MRAKDVCELKKHLTIPSVSAAPAQGAAFTSAPIHARPPLDRPAHVVLADGDATARRRLEAHLRRCGYRVQACADAVTVETLLANDPPDAVILALLLPDGTGADVLRRLRQRPACAALPVLLLGTFGSPRDIQQALALGADDYIVKPTTVTVVAARLVALLRRETVSEPPPVLAERTASAEER